jgi:hypothetical protein
VSEDDPKFSAFHTWAQQLDPRAKKRRARKTPTQSPPPERPPLRTPRWKRMWINIRRDFRSGLTQVISGLIVLALGFFLFRSNSESATPNQTPPQPAHPWDEGMTITPGER